MDSSIRKRLYNQKAVINLPKDTHKRVKYKENLHLMGIWEKAKYRSMLLKIDKGFPHIYLIKLIMVSFVLLNNKKKWGTSSL